LDLADQNFEALFPELFLNEHTSQALREMAEVGRKECNKLLLSSWLFLYISPSVLQLVQHFQISIGYFILAALYQA
jgi:hypothetical protein